MDKKRRRQVQFSVLYVLVAVVGVWLSQQLIFRPLVIRWTEVPYSQFLNELEDGNTQFGMTEALVPVRHVPEAGLDYLGLRRGLRQDLGPETAGLIDRETRRPVDEAQATAMELLRTCRTALDEVAEVLVDREVISGEDVARIAREAASETERVVEA